MPAKTKPLTPRQSLMPLWREWDCGDPGHLPFGALDVSAGVENELQAVVQGPGHLVDLPEAIRESTYYANVKKRLQRGELPQRALRDLDEYLENNPSQVWENSWVRLPLSSLGEGVKAVLERDLLADKQNPAGGRRQDAGLFFRRQGEEQCLRVPVSYLLKLALAQVLDSQPDLPRLIASTGQRFLAHFLSDNTSPETFSFHVVQSAPAGGLGRAVAGETAKRFVLTNLLVEYTRSRFRLDQHGQKPLVYFAPHPPVRQKQLNAAIPDSFYRELFMSPCLSGWDKGEKKHRYMHLCHQVLSRSQLNTLVKLREAGIIQNNLVVLPQTSNISLANNGTHVSLGSKMLTQALADGRADFAPAQEKFVGDLAIKFMEHFLPLFVGAHSAAPYRLDFTDFHPELVLGFLPHELDYTHLRMLWRRWRKKAKLKALGVRITPFGPLPLDRALARLFGLRGDLVPDFRMVDYLASPLSSESAPALDGSLGNQERLKRELAQAGVFEPTMATYLLMRQRQFDRCGYSGFEARHYSLFPSLLGDMAPAVDLQALLTALAFRLIAQGRLRHADIPDDPHGESERRQIFFGAAVGVPTFFVHRQTGNRLLLSLVQQTPRVRLSRRYPNYVRVHNLEYRRALVAYLRREAADLLEDFGGPALMRDLQDRLEGARENAADSRLCRAILNKVGASDPMKVSAEQFNRAAEDYYRRELRALHLSEGMETLANDLASPQFRRATLLPEFRAALDYAGAQAEASQTVRGLIPKAMAERLSEAETLGLINLLLISLAHDARLNRPRPGGREHEHHAQTAPPVH